MASLMGHVLAGVGLLAAWCTFAYFCPRKRCRKCSGWGSRQKRRRRSGCGRCQATGRTMRLSAVLAHHAVDIARGQVREVIERRREAG